MYEESHDKISKTIPRRAKSGLNIPDFCDMDRFEQVMKDWAKSTGLATVAVGSNGKYVSGCYNFTDFCQKLTRKSPEGLRRCIECDNRGFGTYLCHAGLVDFAAPITLEDGTLLGNIIGGQVLPERPDEEKFRATARELGIDEDTYIEALRKVNIRSREEIKASADLLANVVNMFVRTSYAARQNAASLNERAGIISSLSRIYFCDYYIDLEADRFLELDATEALGELSAKRSSAADLLADIRAFMVEPESAEDFRAFTDLSTLSERIGKRYSVSFEFLNGNEGWCRAVFITVRREMTGLASHVIFALQNIQEEKEKELETRKALQEAADEANRANQAKSDFLARMSHDMRTPLTAVIGVCDIAFARYSDPELTRYFETIKNSSEYLQSILTDILDMQKLISGNVTLSAEICREEETERIVEAIIKPMADMKFIDFQEKTSQNAAGLFLKGDMKRTRQIIINLLNNAVKYSGEGSVIHWTTDAEEISDNRILITRTISDNGPGMPEEFQKIMYEPFTREKVSPDSQGSGLGLAIVKKLVDLMGGTIQCDSAPGRGTTFTVKLPYAKASEEEIGAYPGNKESASSFALCSGRHLLLCEDNAINAEIIRQLLEAKQITADHAVNGAEAIEMARNKRYDAILMDIRMPVMDGYEAASRIREFDSEIPIIALSANNFPEDIEKSIRSGMNAHIAKPIDTKKFFAELGRLLGESKTRPATQ